MRRRYVTATVLCAVAGGAHAQNVTLYGIVDGALTMAWPGNGSHTVFREDSGVSNGSRFGFLGNEDLGGGLHAKFQLENGFATNTGVAQQGGAMFGRQAWVGLTSDRGWSVTLGRQYSPVDISLALSDAASQIFWGNTLVTGNGIYQSPLATSGSAGLNSTARISNSLLGSFSRSGVELKVIGSTGDQNVARTGLLYGTSLTYSNDTIYLTAAFNRFRQYAADIPADAAGAWQMEATFGAVYRFGFGKVYAGYYFFNPSETNKNLTATTFTSTSTYWVGIRIPVFVVDDLIAEVLRTRFNYADSHGSGTTIGVTYAHYLSKRTTVYVTFGEVNNASNAAAILWAGTAVVNYPAKQGVNPRAFSIGIRQMF
nr:porin [Burkholderia sp. Ac-20353]